MAHTPHIPEISDERINTLARRIRPVVRYERTIRYGIWPTYERHPEGELHHVQQFDPDWTYLWDASPRRRARDLEELERIVTYHTCGHPIFFKPSIREVIAQIPERALEHVVAFEVRDPKTVADTYHAATTILYRKATPHDP